VSTVPRIAVVSTRGIGPERGGRTANEDNYLICQAGTARFLGATSEETVPVDGVGVLLAVADGMGGHDHGALASGAAVQALSRLYRGGQPSDPELALHSFVLRAHRRLQTRARERGAANMGTTLTAIWLFGDRLYWVHVGDSRLYLSRGGQLRQITRDHTRGEFAQRDGRKQPPGADALTQNFIFGSRSLGDDAGIRVDAGTDTGELRLLPGDRLMLCSDGVHGYLAEARIASVLAEDATPAEASRRMVEESVAVGSDDNITVLVVAVGTVRSLDAEQPEYELF
jgi:PPM family protein phosphatase